MAQKYDLRPGTFGLAQIGGIVGLGISIGQFVIGDSSKYTHAFIVLDDESVLEAKPSGAGVVPLSRYTDGRKVAFSWPIELTTAERERIVKSARDLEGVKYGFSAFLYLALLRFGIKWGWLRRYMLKNGRLICSQLVDAVYARAGVQLFDDGREPFEVTPGDLANVLIERDWRKRLLLR